MKLMPFRKRLPGVKLPPATLIYICIAHSISINMLKPPLELVGGGHEGTTAKQGPCQLPTIHCSFRCCLQIAVCSRRSEIPHQSTVLLTDENPTCHAVSHPGLHWIITLLFFTISSYLYFCKSQCLSQSITNYRVCPALFQVNMVDRRSCGSGTT